MSLVTRRLQSALILCTILCAAAGMAPQNVRAQSAAPPPQADRVAAKPDLRTTTRLQGHIPAWVVDANDAGAVPDDTPLRLTVVLSRSPALEAAFTQLLADQQDPASPSFHHWLTPQQIGDQYGPTQHDIAALTTWLAARGLTVIDTSPSRIFLTVNSTVGATAAALNTSFRYFNLAEPSTQSGAPATSTRRLAATADPAIPAAFAAIVKAINGLADIPVHPMHRMESRPMPSTAQPGSTTVAPQPQFTSGSGNHYVTPGDFATIFDLNPVYQSGINGAGQKVAIIGRSRIVATDVSEFETNTGLAANQPTTIIPTTGADPGINATDEGEALLDVVRVIGTAPGISADLVVSSNASGGIFTAASYEVQTVLDPVMNISFGACEVYAGPSSVSAWDTLFAQAAAEGISVFVSAADSGAATCDTQFATPGPYQFRSINYICASSYATCVGATEFADFANPSLYWSTTNTTNRASAIGYIPEGAWNEPVSTDSTTGVTSYIAASGGGGASIYITKPAWQTGTGVPADSARDVPDVAFPGAGHDGYYACYAGGDGDCAAGRFEYFSGTSAAAPGMAAVTALLNQKTGTAHGNMNPLFYKLAASTPTAFHDATPATSGVTTCDINTPSMCNNSVPSPTDLTGGLAGFALTTGYDQATGLGSLDINNFLTAAALLPTSTLAHTSLSIIENTAVIPDTQTDAFSATLTSATSGTPSGTVQFYANDAAIGTPIPLLSGRAVTPSLPFPNAGSYLITAIYSGDGTYASSTAPGISLTVRGLNPTIKISALSPSIPIGATTTFTAVIVPPSGTTLPTGIVRFYASSPANSGYIATVPLIGGIATTPAISFPAATASYTITAYYLGDTVYSPSSAGTSVAIVKVTPSITLQASLTSLAINVPDTFTATIAPSGPITPTGTIQFLQGSTTLGSVALASGIAPSISASFATAGVLPITANYSGDANFSTGSATINITVTSGPPAYQLSVAAPTISLTAGATSGNTDTVNIGETNGFAGTVNLACAVAYNGTGTPNFLPTCNLASTAIAINTAPASTTLSITTTIPHAIKSSALRAAQAPPDTPGLLKISGIAFSTLLLCLIPIRRRTSPSAWKLLAFILILGASLATLSGCGHSTPAPSPPPTPIGTTTGSYTVTITASSTVTGVAAPAPATITLTVN